MAMSREALEAEIRRRGLSPAAQPAFSKDALAAELKRRGVSIPIGNEQALANREARGDVASQELGESRTPGFLDYVPGVGLAQDIPDILQDGFNSPEIRARRERREQAAKTLVPYATAALGGAAGAVARPAAGLVGRALGAGAGSAVGDVAGQAATQRGQVDPAQTAAAAAGGTLGQPVGEAFGAVAPAVGRFLTRGGKAGREEAQQAIADAARFGATPTVGQISGRKGVSGLENLVSKAPGGAGRFRKVVDDTLAKVQQNVTRLAEYPTGGEVSAEVAGRTIRRGVDDFVAGFKDKSSKAFQKLDDHIAPDTPVSVQNYADMLAKVADPTPGAAATSARLASPTVKGLLDDLGLDAASGQTTFQALRSIRTKIGEKINDAQLVGDVNQGELKQLYGALSKDIEAAAKAAGPKAEQALKRANRFYRAGSDRIEGTLQPLVRGRFQDRILAGLESGGREGSTQIRSVMKSLSPEQQDIVTGSIIKRLGRATGSQQDETGEAFSFGTLLTRWANLDQRAKDALFKRGRNYQMGQDMDALARYANRVRETSNIFANPSGTAAASIGQTYSMVGATSPLLVPVLGAGALVPAAGVGAAMVGSNLTARLLTSPKVVHWLAQATKLKPDGYGAHLGRLASIAAKEDPDVQEAIGAYLGALQEDEQPNTPPAPEPQPQPTPVVEPDASPAVAASDPRLDALQAQMDEMAKTQAVAENRAKEFATLARDQQAFMGEQLGVLSETQQLLAEAPTSPDGQWTRQGADVVERDDQGRAAVVEVTEANEDGKTRVRRMRVKRDDFGRFTGLEKR